MVRYAPSGVQPQEESDPRKRELIYGGWADPRGLEAWSGFGRALGQTWREPQAGESVIPFLPKLRYEDTAKVLFRLMESPGTEFVQPIVGLNTRFGIEKIQRPMDWSNNWSRYIGTMINKGRARGPMRRELNETVDVWLAVPRKLQRYIDDISWSRPSEFRDPSHKYLETFYIPEVRTIKFVPSAIKRHRKISLPSGFGHEVGHAGTERILRKMGVIGEPESLLNVYEAKPMLYEGIAEYLGDYLQAKAGLVPETMFGYGKGQQEVYSELVGMSSKNPWMNVYHYLQKNLP